MITVTVFRESGRYRGFTCSGHAEYADEGSDIICAAVSALTVNAVNSVERFTGDSVSASSADGLLQVQFGRTVSKETALLLDSMISGLEDIQKNYGNEYLKIVYKEV